MNGLPDTSETNGLCHDGYTQFLVFQIGELVFGTPLLDVMEVSDAHNFTYVPNTSKAFVGMANLRGRIVGVIDLRKKFNLAPRPDQPSILLIFQTPKGTVGAQVNMNIAVSAFSPQQIDYESDIKTPVGSRYVIGVGMNKEDLVPIINLVKLLTDENVVCDDDSKFSNTRQLTG